MIRLIIAFLMTLFLMSKTQLEASVLERYHEEMNILSQFSIQEGNTTLSLYKEEETPQLSWLEFSRGVRNFIHPHSEVTITVQDFDTYNNSQKGELWSCRDFAEAYMGLAGNYQTGNLFPDNFDSEILYSETVNYLKGELEIDFDSQDFNLGYSSDQFLSPGNFFFLRGLYWHVQACHFGESFDSRKDFTRYCVENAFLPQIEKNNSEQVIFPANILLNETVYKDRMKGPNTSSYTSSESLGYTLAKGYKELCLWEKADEVYGRLRRGWGRFHATPPAYYFWGALVKCFKWVDKCGPHSDPEWGYY
jgi:hypothetical protein